MNWDLLDYLTLAVLVMSATIIVFLAWRRSRTRSYRIAAAVAAAGAFFLVWVNGAVGIIGNEENDANLLFFGVLAVAAAGSLIARFRAGGMAVALYATAGAQLLVAAFAISMRLGATAPAWPRGLLLLTLFFSTFWFMAAWLFGKAAKSERRLFAD